MPTMAPPEPEVFDIVIFGASRFTGKYVVREALKFLDSSSSPSPLRSLAVAGRSRDRIASALRWATAPEPPPEDVPILVADTSDPASIAALVGRARVLLSCAGPFRLYGHVVAAACAAAGVDCLDISGEPEFMERVEAELHEPATRTGSLIVSASGLSSVPAELGFLFHSRQWEPPSVLVCVEAYVSLHSTKRIVENIDSYKSAVLGVANATQLQALRRSKPRRPKPNILGPPPPKGSLIERCNPLGMWATKLSSVDTVIVKRTLSTLTEHPEGLPGVEESLEYAEHRKKLWSSVKPTHFAVKIASKSFLMLVRFIITGIFISRLANFSFGRSLLLKYPWFFSAGMFSRAGPTDEEVNNFSFMMWFVGHGYNNVDRCLELQRSKPNKEVITRVSRPDVTPIVLVQCALVLLSQRASLPKGGVYTSGTIFGPTDLQQRLQDNGLSFEVNVSRTMH